jgi:hypothetical protein
MVKLRSGMDLSFNGKSGEQPLLTNSLKRSGEEFRPQHGMIWKDGDVKYFLNLTNVGIGTEFVQRADRRE